MEIWALQHQAREKRYLIYTNKLVRMSVDLPEMILKDPKAITNSVMGLGKQLKKKNEVVAFHTE